MVKFTLGQNLSPPKCRYCMILVPSGRFCKRVEIDPLAPIQISSRPSAIDESVPGTLVLVALNYTRQQG